VVIEHSEMNIAKFKLFFQQQVIVDIHSYGVRTCVGPSHGLTGTI